MRSGISSEKARLKFMYIFMSTDMVKTYLKTVLSKILLTQLKSDIGLYYEVIDLSDFLKTAVTLAGFQNDGKHIFLRDKLNSLQSGRQIVFSLAIIIR